MLASKIRFETLAPALGAVVHGVDVHSALSEADGAELNRALHQYGVLVFESDRKIDNEAYKAFARTFGEPEIYPFGLNNDAEITPIQPGVPRTDYWHTDGTPLECPPQAAILTPVTLPESGGDTMWASMYAAWESLSSPLQRLLDGLEAFHTTAAVTRHYDLGQENAFGAGQSHVHPVVLRDPVTDKRMLYVNSNYTARILGLRSGESEKILQLLFEHVNTPEFHFRLRWQPNMIAVWEERITQHRALSDYTGERVLNRIALAGDRPTS